MQKSLNFKPFCSYLKIDSIQVKLHKRLHAFEKWSSGTKIKINPYQEYNIYWDIDSNNSILYIMAETQYTEIYKLIQMSCFVMNDYKIIKILNVALILKQCTIPGRLN